MDADSVADELYSLPPKEFTAARDARVKQARAAGDRTTATAVAALRKPTVVAWLANQLARQRAAEIGALLELGAALREATATLTGPELRRLSSQRQQVVHALVRHARVLGQDAGQRVTEDVARGLEETLNAALADPAAADRLTEARLVDGMAHHGYGTATTSTASPGPGSLGRDGATGVPTPAGTPSADELGRAQTRSRLEHELGDSWRRARDAADERDRAATEADRTQRVRVDAAREVTRLRAEVVAAESALEAADRDEQGAGAARDLADTEAQRARQRVTELQSRLDAL